VSRVVPHSFACPPDQLSGLLEQLAHQKGEKIALDFLSPRYVQPPVRYADLPAQVQAMMGALQALSLSRGDRIALWLPNNPQWMVLHFAAAQLGLTTIPINTWCRETEIGHYLGLSGARAIVVEPGFLNIDFSGILENVMAQGDPRIKLKWVLQYQRDMATPLPSCESKAGLTYVKLQAVTGHRASPSDVSLAQMIAYSTSGTTSLPKLAVHGEAQTLSHAHAVAERARMSDQDVMLCALPPCGAYGYGVIMAALVSGARAVLLESFDLDRLIAAIVSHKVTMMALTEPILRQLLDHPMASRTAFASLRIVYSAGATLEPVVARAEQEFGFRISNVYGSSEILALAAFWGFTADVPARSAAGGILTSPGMHVRAVDAGATLTPGVSGELEFKGPVVMQGYLDNSEATQKAFTQDGWFRSGDVGFVDDAQGTCFHYIARGNDALRLKGFLVNPGEIEDKLQSHPNVQGAQVVGVPNGMGEDVAAAFIILSDKGATSSEDLLQYCRAGMASYKLPALIEIIDVFPTVRSANGDKVQKTKLRDLAREKLKL